ncbi:protein kinase [Skermania sp. ID1734]|uniref:protein kinase domain-containing protein n=1 Tax=Skermania sp. ID1734 TaxID=2597516 RepID=UPI00117D6BD2|nr:protein kinase [Skermania sp. ID1734]TSE00067.1 protein kinase [Skermania sp. ID1734]
MMDEVVFGRYRLLDVIGQGGMGRVYRATDTRLDRPVAVKVLPQLLADDERYRERFRGEARKAGALRDPHVIPIHDADEIDGHLYLCMELIDGEDLSKILAREGALRPKRAVSIISQAASALDTAHAQGLIHRDVKPSNLLVARRDFVYLIDFGIARASGEVGLTTAGAAIGSLPYMAPERFTSDVIDARTDVYALACVLHECLTGTTPYGGGPERQFYHHLNTVPPRPSTLVGDAVVGLDAVIARGMAKLPDRRYQSAGELAAAAEEVISSSASTSPMERTRISTGTNFAEAVTELEVVPCRIGVVEDHESTVLGLKGMLADERDLTIVATAPTVPELLAITSTLDLVILDLRLPDGSTPSGNVALLRDKGIEALVFTSGEEQQLVRAAARAGVLGVVRKSERSPVVVQAIRDAVAGRQVVTTDWAAAIDADWEFTEANLTPRQRQVLELFASGEPAPRVSAMTGLSEETLTAYLGRIRQKYGGLRDQTQ